MQVHLAACSLHVGAHPAIIEHARKLITAHQFNNDPPRILMASLAPGLRSTDAFISSTLQKHMFRDIKLADVALKVNNEEGGGGGGGQLIRWNASIRRWAPAVPLSTAKKEQEEPDLDEDEEEDGVGGGGGGGSKPAAPSALPTKANPILTAIYGQICVAAKSYQSALCESGSCFGLYVSSSLVLIHSRRTVYLQYAYDACPEDPMLCLSLAIASIGRAMQRQADNRHHLIAQGVAFLSLYRKHRRETSDEEQEIQYNFGRAFHQLGTYCWFRRWTHRR